MSMPVMREQISIYNYPEHLNPFYKDEQHKRLRFWKIKKDKVTPTSSSTSDLKRQRSGSFSFGSIKDWLPLKTFTLRKRSSVLGVSKTSESPPSYHRDMTAGSTTYIEDPSKYTDYNPHFRRSTGAGNVNYRTSLQNMNQYNHHHHNDFQLRNSRWRQTIQNGSITPSMRMRFGGSEMEMKSGISMSSINTNPFDDDYDGQSLMSSTSTTQLNSKQQQQRKKKRRAPQPPVQRNRHHDDDEKMKCESIEAEGISRLTKDFEKFVMETEKHRNNELRIDEGRMTLDVLREATPESIPLPVREKFDVLRIEEDIDEVKVKVDEEEMSRSKKKESDKEVIEQVFKEIIVDATITPVTTTRTTMSTTTSDINDVENIEIEKVEEENFSSAVGLKALSEDEKIIFGVIEKEETPDGRIEKKIINTKTSSMWQSKSKPEPAESSEKFDELEKSYSNHHEEEEIISTSVKEAEVDYRRSSNNNFERVKVSSYTLDSPRHAQSERASFLQTFSASQKHREVTPIPTARTERDSSPPIPPVRRRSVKDIIESINRNQQMLKVNQPVSEDFRTKFLVSSSSDPRISLTSAERFNEIVTHERNVENLLDDLQNYQKL